MDLQTLAGRMKALVLGHKLHNTTHWDKYSYIQFNADGDSLVDETCKVIMPMALLQNGTWKIWEKPKQKVKLYQWAFHSKYTNHWLVTKGLYPDEATVRTEEHMYTDKKLVRLDHTMIEVEQD